MKKEYLLTGLGCANCSAKIEKEINNLDYVNTATVSFATTKLSLETDLKEEDRILADIIRIVASIEKHIVVKKVRSGMDKDGHSHSHNHRSNFGLIIFIRLSISILLLILASRLNISESLRIVLFASSYLIAGGDVLIRAAKNIFKGEIFDENFLMSVATIGAFLIGEYAEGIAVMMFYQVGEYFQERAVSNSRKSIEKLMDIRPDYANLLIGGESKKVSPDEVNIGDIIIVKPGEKIPLDGIIKEGKAMLNTSALTGESVPREVIMGDAVLSGFLNENGVLTIEVTSDFANSTVSKILDLVQNSASQKAPTEKFITKFSKIYTPIVLLMAVVLALIPPLILKDALFSDWLYRALTFLVISCPCALVISVPLGFFGGIGAASRNGILVKGGNYLEALTSVDTIVFDKTGTLTKGVFEVSEIVSELNYSNEEVLRYASYAEYYSTHPVGASILKRYTEPIDSSLISEYEEIAGKGIKVLVDGKVILAGNKKLMDSNKILFNKIDDIKTLVYVAINNQYIGCIKISDEIKSDSKEAVKGLREIGVNRLIMLTGDKKEVADTVANDLNLDSVYSELLPNNKVEEFNKLIESKEKGKKIAFVGDGINDAPVLAGADIGIAMGGLGSDAAIEASDIVLMTDEPSKIIKAIHIAKKTKVIVMQNILFALGIKAIILLLGALGIASMWLAVFADVGVSLIAVLNSMRSLRL